MCGLFWLFCIWHMIIDILYLLNINVKIMKLNLSGCIELISPQRCLRPKSI